MGTSDGIRGGSAALGLAMLLCLGSACDGGSGEGGDAGAGEGLPGDGGEGGEPSDGGTPGDSAVAELDAGHPSADAGDSDGATEAAEDGGVREYTPLLVADFNEGVIGDGARGPSGISQAFSGTLFSDERVFEGALSAAMTVPEGSTAFGAWGGSIVFPRDIQRGEELWWRMRVYFPAGYDFSTNSGSLKFFRIHTRSASETNYGYHDLQIRTDGTLRHIYEGEHVWTGASGTAAIEHDRWHTVELYVKLDTVPAAEGGEGRVRAWLDGELLIDADDRITLAAADAYAEFAYIFSYWNGGAPRTQTSWIDDIVLASDADPPTAVDAEGHPFIGL